MRLKNLNTDILRKILLTGFVFTIPNSVALNNIILVLLLIYWIICGDKTETLRLVKTNPVVMLSLAYFFINVAGLLWTENLKWGFAVIMKEKYFLLLPVFMSLIKKEEKELVIKTFILTMTFSELISYGVKLGILPEMFHATRYEPVPFIGHIHYSPFVAFCVYILMYLFLYTKLEKIYKAVALFFIITMTANLFLTGGRAGQVVYFVLFAVLILQYFKVGLKSVLIITLGIPLIFLTAYKGSGIFHDRVNLAVHSIKTYKQNRNTNIGKRFTFWENTAELIKKHPVLGVGTGDFIDEYRKINEKNSPQIRVPGQPHNMYLLIYAQTGIAGLFLFLALFYAMFYYALKTNDKYRPLRIGLVVYFLVIMFSDSYLFSHYGEVLFVIFTSILYKEIGYENKRGNNSFGQ
ncbi:O-antigen ligase family protein [Nautilia sp.]